MDKPTKLKTFADLKRDANTGRLNLVLLERYGKVIPQNQKVMCPVISVKSKGLNNSI